MKEETTYVEYTEGQDTKGWLPIHNIDFDKLYNVMKKSLPIIIVIFLVCNLSAYLYLRYTKPLYRSDSELQLGVNKQADFLGYRSLDSDPNQNMNGMSEEIELIKSKLFLTRVLKAVDLDVSYFEKGKILDDEKYRSSPFEVSYLVKDESFFNRRFFVRIHNSEEYTLSYQLGDQEISGRHRFGQTVETDPLTFSLSLRNGINKDIPESRYYFIINSDNALINYFRQNLSVSILNPSAKTIKISLSDHNPFKAKVLVDVLSNMYLGYTEEEKIKSNSKRIAFLDEQVEETEAKLEDFESYFENFTIDYKTTNLAGDINRTIIMMEAIDSQRVQLRKQLSSITSLASRIEAEDSYFAQSLVNRQDGNFPAELKGLVEELNTLTSEKEILLASQNENTQAVQLRNKKISAVKEELANAIQGYESGIRKELNNLQNRQKQLQSTFVRLPSKGTEFNKSQRNYQQLLGFLLNLQSKKIELEIENAGTTTDFKILSSASLPSAPISPDKWVIHGLGFMVSMMLTVLFVGSLYTLDNKVNGVIVVEEMAHAPLLGALPQTNNKYPTARMIVTDNPRSAFSESLRSIRTNMEFVGARQNTRLISITSTVSGEGKTFVAVNLAAVIALSKKKVIILDLDMRKPKVHLALDGENASEGISTILIGKHSLESSIKKTAIPNLDYIPAGPTPPNPSELVMNSDFDAILSKLKERYDVIVMDTPPVGLVTDGILIMQKVDLALYVFRANYSRKAYFNTLNRLVNVNQFTNLSVIVNGVSRRKGYGYGYGYGYGGGYGHGYFEQ
ncbi:GumC family protein [Cesiribacter andamanensis]|uniref:non-specific protein-tyrosine kinase n=1 Tax=Cesiribacter andamanensis AMV16 TaxID=1279009 RepID=M7N6D4_9BACT|nr:polysaccharide biosynthesis tyrosine autokinase [Cesiribacter andamanensis]EMR02837.1 Tyrosine-protein kinase wzc [Cesiribacter andamanensis AMV16]